MGRKNKRQSKMDPREKRFLAGEAPETLAKPQQRRRRKGKDKKIYRENE